MVSWSSVELSGSDDALPLPLEERRQPNLLALLPLLSNGGGGGLGGVTSQIAVKHELLKTMAGRPLTAKFSQFVHADNDYKL